MNRPENLEITQILKEWNNGSEQAAELLFPYIYAELKRQARLLMSGERAGHTLQPTALVHETFIRLSEQTNVEWQNRSHFYGIASRLMRQILVDHARLQASKKRGGSQIIFSLDEVQSSVEDRADSILALDEVLARLSEYDERQAKIVEMRFFGGMSNKEIAKVFVVSERTVIREWQSARFWIYNELNNL